MNLHHFFSAQDEYELEFQEQEGFVFHHTITITSHTLTHRKLFFLPSLRPAQLAIDYSINTEDAELQVYQSMTSMSVNESNGEEVTPCPFCGCEVEEMTLISIPSEEGLRMYSHQCPFTEQSLTEVAFEIDNLEMVRMGRLEEFIREGLVQIEKHNDTYGFIQDRHLYTFLKGQVFHSHLQTEKINCSYCSCQEPLLKREGGITLQLCPVLTAEAEQVYQTIDKAYRSFHSPS